MAKLSDYENGVIDGWLLNAPILVKDLINKLRTEESPKSDYNLDTAIGVFINQHNFSARAINLLGYLDIEGYVDYRTPRKEIKTIGDLISLTERELLSTPNFGRVTLNELKEALSLHNLKFAE